MKCLDCGNDFYQDENHKISDVCPECLVKMKKRTEFRKIMDTLEKIAKGDRIEVNYMSGFSYAEMERFSLIFKRIVKRFYFPNKDAEFVNFYAKKELEELKKIFVF